LPDLYATGKCERDAGRRGRPWSTGPGLRHRRVPICTGAVADGRWPAGHCRGQRRQIVGGQFLLFLTLVPVIVIFVEIPVSEILSNCFLMVPSYLFGHSVNNRRAVPPGRR
jgi:hypothetical protein